MIRRIADWIARHRTFLRFGIASTLFSVSGMVSGIIVIRWMMPEELGLWQSVLIIQTWAMIFQSGVITGLGRELPFHTGRNELSYVDELAATAQSVALAGLLLLGAAAVIAPFFATDPRLKLAFAAVFLTSGMTIYQNYLGTTYRASRAFEQFSTIQLIDSGIAVLSLPMVYYWGFPGLAARYAMMTLISTIMRHLWRPIRVRPSFSVKHLMSLLKVGTPMFAFGYVLQTVDTFPRLILLGKENGVLLVGLFAPAAAVLGLLQILPKSLGSYVFPQMNFKLGKTQSAGDLWPISWKSSVYYMLLAAPFAFAGTLVFPYAIREFFPRYVEAIPAIGWALAAGIFMGTRISINSLNSLKAWWWLAAYTVVSVGGAWLFPWLLEEGRDPLVSVTMGYAVSRIVLFVFGLFCIRRATRMATA